MSSNSGNLFYQICTQVHSKTYLEELMIKLEASFDIIPYKINKLHAEVAKKIYNLSKFKYQISKELTPNPDVWYQNQRKLFIWFIVCYFHQFQTQQLDQTKIHFFIANIDWLQVSQTFFGKNVALLKFQFNNILKHKHRISWTIHEDQLLSAAVTSAGEGAWNQISKHIFFQSGLSVFKTPKHCRQRWLNHLDNSKKRGKWTDQQDLKLLTFVKEYGKKWSKIAEYLNHTRTEHMVKNRFNSLMTKIRKNKKQKEIHTINKILRHLESALKPSSQTLGKQVPVTEIVQSEQCISESDQQIQNSGDKIEDIDGGKSQQNLISLEGKLNEGSPQLKDFLPAIKTQAQIEMRPVQNVFINFLVPNTHFLEPQVFFCYNMLPTSGHYMDQKSNQFWSYPTQVQTELSPNIQESSPVKMQPVYIIKPSPMMN